MATKKKRPQTESDANAASVIVPSVRTQTEWTPTRIRSIIRMVEGGDLSQAGVLCDWILIDDRVRATFAARFDALFGLEPTFDLGVGRRSKQAQKALEAGEDWWEAYPEPQLRKMAVWGQLLGVSLMRQTWIAREDHSGRVLPHLTFWHPSCLKQDQKTKQWFARDANNVQHEVNAGDGEWMMHLPFGAERPWAEGDWRCLAQLCLAKSYARTDISRTGEKGGLTVGTSDHEADNTLEHRATLANDIKNSGSGGVAILRAGFDLKQLGLVANTEALYNSQITMIDEAIAVVVRGGNLSTVTKEGSLAGAKQQAKTSDTPKLAFDAAAVSGTVHDQSLVWWAELNFGDRRLAPWPNYPVEPEEDKAAKASTAKTVMEAATLADKLGYEIDTDELADEYGLPWLGERKAPEDRPQPVAPTADPTDSEDDPAEKAKPKKKTKAMLMLALASGASVSANRGFVEGQQYTDDVVDAATAAATTALEPDMVAIAQAVQDATSYEDLRERLRALYAEMSATDLSELVFRAMMLGEMAGRRSVNQDA
jgi:phage gp29-like protein